MQASTYRASAPGKVNLYLAVGPLRADGYHEVASLYAATQLEERVTMSRGTLPGLKQTMSVQPDSPVARQVAAGAFDPAQVPLDESNLAYRGAEAVLGERGLKVADLALELHIEKAVPVAGGMGGGSADAAAAMKAMDAFLVGEGYASEPLPLERLLDLAAPLGADVPFALLGGLALGRGVGDQLTPLELPAGVEPLSFGFVPSSEGLSTPAVFRELDAGRAAGRYPAADENLEVPAELLDLLTSRAPKAERLPALASLVRNDLAAPALTLQPQLKKVLEVTEQENPGVTSLVSGSGPTIVYIF